MFGLFKKKSKVELLFEKYGKLLKEAHDLSTSNRRQSDSKFAQASEMLKEIDLLKNA